MSEELEETVVQEVVADAQQGTEEHFQEVQSSPPAKAEERSQDRNWREMRQAMNELKNRNDALETDVARMRQTAPQQDVEEVFADDDLSTVSMTKKLIQKEAARIAKQVVKEREALTVEDRVRSKYTDYDAVVNKDNLERLFVSAPELVNMLKANQDNPYDQAVAAYKLMKQFGVSGEETEKLKQNQSKPRSVNSVGQTSALSQANSFSRGLTPDLRKQLWNEMKEASKRA